jgi:hypothetical protein
VRRPGRSAALRRVYLVTRAWQGTSRVSRRAKPRCGSLRTVRLVRPPDGAGALINAGITSFVAAEGGPSPRRHVPRFVQHHQFVPLKVFQDAFQLPFLTVPSRIQQGEGLPDAHTWTFPLRPAIEGDGGSFTLIPSG